MDTPVDEYSDDNANCGATWASGFDKNTGSVHAYGSLLPWQIGGFHCHFLR
jgi:hypothetical protein